MRVPGIAWRVEDGTTPPVETEELKLRLDAFPGTVSAKSMAT